MDNTNAELLEAIDMRRARRRYIPEPLDDATAQAMRDVIAEQAGCRMELVVDNDAAGFSRSYGMFSGVRNYVGMIAPESDRAAIERLGYYGEIVVLRAVMTGLGTCWVGGSFSRSACPFKLEADERIVCIVTLGQVAVDLSVKENLIRGVMHRRSKTVEQMSTTDGPAPDWFWDGLRAVQKAPSAVNRQPVMFDYRDGVVRASIPQPDDDAMLVDLGIAKQHFAIGAGGGTWQWGSGAEFTHC